MPITELLMKGIELRWTNQCEECFRKVKERHTSILVSTLPKMGETFIVSIDASRGSYGGVLKLEGRVITYTSW